MQIKEKSFGGAVVAIVVVILLVMSILGCVVAPLMFASSLVGPLVGIGPPTEIPTPTRTPKPTFTPPATYTPTPDVTIDFRVDDDHIIVGQTVILTWNVQNAENVFLNDNPVEHQGSTERQPQVTRTWILRAEGPTGSVERQVTVVVEQPSPTPTSLATNTPTSTPVPPTPTRRPAAPTPTRRPATPTPRRATPAPVYSYAFRYVQNSMRVFPNCGTVYFKGKIVGMGGEAVNGKTVRIRFADNVDYKTSGVGEAPGQFGFAPLAQHHYHSAFIFQIDIVESQANPVPESDTLEIVFNNCEEGGQFENIVFEYVGG